MQVELARKRQRADEMEAICSRRSDDEQKQTSVGISRGKGTGTANLAHHCQQLAEYDKALQQKDQEIDEVMSQLNRLTKSSRVHMGDSLTHHESSTNAPTRPTSIIPPARTYTTVRLSPTTPPAKERATPEITTRNSRLTSRETKR